ncbi:hypothetical protein GIB67_042651, partial [Kingdonia uniflora]
KYWCSEAVTKQKRDTLDDATLKHQSNLVISVPNEVHVDSSKPLASKEDNQNALNGPRAVATDLLHRGLINSGNLCFLNSSLHVFLFGSPFVQLLQDLRAHTIPKIGYPTLSAFLQFISEFDMPTGSSLIKNQRVAIETGSPFCPSMFEQTLKKFSPDVTNSISSKPRQEDSQEFLSFIMYQMHDELLQLEGHFSNSNGGSSSVVSSLEDDGLETVGPKNKTDITRTQSFVPSELSVIFGGQLRSTVKARGSKASVTIQPQFSRSFCSTLIFFYTLFILLRMHSAYFLHRKHLTDTDNRSCKGFIEGFLSCNKTNKNGRGYAKSWSEWNNGKIKILE